MSKRALLVGINYENSSNQLNGCVNDIIATKNNLIAHYGFKEENIVLMHEHASDINLIPNKNNMIAQIKKFVGSHSDNINASCISI